MNIYKGHVAAYVTVNGKPLSPRTDIENHSPTGFAWSYGGSGPAQLALAIMVNEYGEDLSTHPYHYQDFKFDVIAGLGPEFEISSIDIEQWLDTKRRSA